MDNMQNDGFHDRMMAFHMEMRRLRHRPSYRFMAVNRIVPHIPWAILMVLAVYLYKQRIFADSGFYVSQFINNRIFWIECQRYVLAISQILPLTAVWLHLPMRYVLVLYSISHVLFFYFLFLLTYYGLRDRRGGLLILLFQLVGIVYSFYTPMFELYYGAPLLIVFYSIWQMKYRSGGVYALLVVIEILALTSHPLAFMLLAFILAYDYFGSSRKRISAYLPFLGIMVLVAVFKAWMMCDYERSKLGWQFNYTDNVLYRQFFQGSFYVHLGRFLLARYWEALLALTISSAILARRKQYGRLAVVLGTFGAYMFLVNSNYTVNPSRYMEQVMFPFVPLTFIPLIYSYRSQHKLGLHSLVVLAVGGLIVYRLLVIYEGSEGFVRRTRQMEQLIAAARQAGGNKFILASHNVDMGFTQLNWSYPFESMLLSAEDGNDIAVTLAPDEDYFFEGNDKKLKPNQFLFRKWELKDHSWLNPTYFHFDLGPYRMLSDTIANQQTDKLIRPLVIKNLGRRFYRAGDTVWIPVELVKNTKTLVATGGSNKLELSYLWEKEGQVLDWGPLHTPMQCDLYGNMMQYVKVAVPDTKGRLMLKLDLLSDGQWMGRNSQDLILVY